MRILALAIPILLASCGKQEESSGTSTMPQAVTADRSKDPVCGMMVDKDTTRKAAHEGSNYYFCADECLKKFQVSPSKFAVACECGKTAKKCACGHCDPKGETCDCG